MNHLKPSLRLTLGNLARILCVCTFATVGTVAVGNKTVHGQEKAAVPARTAAATLTAEQLAATSTQEDPTQFFTQKIRPVLAQNCYTCHTDEAAGGLRLDSRAAVLKGGDSGPAMVPGHPETSLIIASITHSGDLKMPKKADKLSDADIANMIEWVKRGGIWDSADAIVPVAAPVSTSVAAPGSAPAATAVKVSLTAAQAKAGPGEDFFENNVRPIFANNCATCHMDKASGGLSLNSREEMLKGGDTPAPAIVVGDPEKSLLLQAVHQTGDLKMPPKGREVDRRRDRHALAMGEDGRILAQDHRARPHRQGHHRRTCASGGPSSRSSSPEVPVIKDPRPQILGEDRHRPLRPRQARRAGPQARRDGRQAHPDPSRHARPDRPAAHA